jgi:PBSX family phage portal protein
MMEQGKIVEMQKNASAKSNQQVRALVIGGVSEDPVAKAVGAEPGKSKELPTDPFQELSAKGNLIEPPFDMLTLAMLPEQSSELNQCVEAMETNIEGFGHRFVPRLDIEQALKDPKVKPILKEVDAEKIRLENFFAYASIDDSMTDLRMKLRKDLETTGNGYLEMIRNAAGDVQGFNHIPSYQMRLAPRDHEQIKIDLPILEKQADGSIKATKLTTWKRFRRFAQSRAVLRVNLSFIGSFKLRWFKEFGDPRVIDNRTGKIGDDSLPEQHRANEIVHFKIYSARSPYGLPRFIGNLLTIFGDRASEEINFVTFRNNNIPSMVVLVSNGQLTDGSIDRIKGFVEAQIQGSDNYSKFLILEGEGDLEGEDGGQIKMEIKPLVKEQHKDALFQNYSSNNQDKIRRAFRLPPIFVGRSDDYTRTTAEASRKLADEQIFAPARTSFDEWINRILFPQMNVVYHKFKSNTPNTTDNTELVKMLAGAEKTGGMTPRIARFMLEDILGTELPPFSPDINPDVPFSLTMAEAVKNKADAAEPGQQVTALKAIEMLTEGTDIFGDASDDQVVDRLLRVNKALEARWQQAIDDASHGDDLEG